MLEIRRMSWEDFKKKKKKTLLNREAAIFTRRSIARAYMMSFWIEVRSSAHSQVLCLTAVLKKKGGPNYETGLEANRRFFIAVNTKQTYRS